MDTKPGFIHADFRGRLGRQTDPVISNHQVLDSQDRDTALISIAFAFGNSEPKRLDCLGLSTAMLSLYAAGAAVKLTRDELWELSAELRRHKDLYRLFELKDNPNGKILNFVFNQAMLRAHRESLQSGSCGDLPIGFKLLRLEPAAISGTDDEKRQLLTIAFNFLHPDPMQVTAQSLSVAMLAIWSAGAMVELSLPEFERLSYGAELLASGRRAQGKQAWRQSQEAKKVLELARQRAVDCGLLSANPDNDAQGSEAAQELTAALSA